LRAALSVRRRYFEVPVVEPAPEPMLPDVLVEVLPEALEPVLAPYWRRHWSRSRPVLPRHWLGVVELPAAAPVSELVLEPVLDPVLGLVVELGELVDPVLLEPMPELLPMLPVPDCAHDAPATATNAAATAVAIVLTITIESPWSVEEGLQAGALQEECPPRYCLPGESPCLRNRASPVCRTVLTTC